MAEEIRGAKALTRVIGRKHRSEVLKLEVDLKHLVSVVDRFYALLGPRHWIFHDRLNVPQVEAILDSSAEEAERKLIEIYRDPEALRFMVMPLNRFTALQRRMHLLDRAVNDYREGRYYSTVLVLLAVMDGFVNDIGNEHRGLHTRSDEEMNAWDSVVGHHMGLTNAHKTFTKMTSKTTDEEVHELYRNGIIHGTITSFDNDVVATKAWNRMFAVADWATSLERREEQPKPKPSWREILAQMSENQKAKQALAMWSPRRLDTTSPGFQEDEVFRETNEYLAFWTKKNYGKMAGYLATITAEETEAATAGVVRSMCADRQLDEYSVLAVGHEAPAICEVDVRLTLSGEQKTAKLRWLRQDAKGNPVAPNQDGEWRIVVWGPQAIVERGS